MGFIFNSISPEKSIDKLLDYFNSNACWNEFKNPQTSNGYSKFEWPDIVLSPKLVTLKSLSEHFNGFDKCIDLMGCYIANEDNNQQGQIVLYYNKIKEVAESFKSKKNDADLEEIKADLTEIVLIHEATHWIIKSLTNFLVETKLPEILYKEIDNINFHESMAQLFTYLYCEKNSARLLDLFNWLAKDQPEPYKLYQVFLKNGIDNFDIAARFLSLLRKDNIQSFTQASEKTVKDIEKYIHSKRGAIKPRQFGF